MAKTLDEMTTDELRAALSNRLGGKPDPVLQSANLDAQAAAIMDIPGEKWTQIRKTSYVASAKQYCSAAGERMLVTDEAVPITEQRIDQVAAIYEHKRQARRVAKEEAAREQARERKRALLGGRLEWSCGPCRMCITQILQGLPVDRALCERP